MAYSKKSTEGRTFVGALIPSSKHTEFSRLCGLAGRSKAKELETAIDVRISQLRRQERQGVIRGVR